MVAVARKTRIVDQHGRPFVVARRAGGALIDRFRSINWHDTLNRYDAAQTTDDNIRHWAWADSLSADAANTPSVRRILRNRSRYESANNSYCRSMVETLANDVIGTGPRVQIVTGAGDKVDKFIERELQFWMFHSKCAKRFRMMRKAKCVDGEGIALLVTKKRLPTPVKLALRTIEAEQLSTPNLTGMEENAVDGIKFDADGDPLAYDVLRYHPGGSWYGSAMLMKYDTIPASDVLHLFREDRPGQHRGVPELTPALPLFSQLRRFTLATLAAAETAAEFAAVVETTNPQGEEMLTVPAAGQQPLEQLDTFELAQRMVTILPDGFKLNQVDAKHPSTTYGEFKREILAEAFAALVMPYAVGANDSKDYNFASGKLDRRGYAKAVAVERAIEWDPETYRVIYSWYLEARLIPGYLPVTLPPFSTWTIQIFWDEVEDDIDPVKAATARAKELETGQVSRRRQCARRGIDYETEEAQIALEYGLTVEEYRRARRQKELGGNVVSAVSTPVSDDDEDSDDDDEE